MQALVGSRALTVGYEDDAEQVGGESQSYTMLLLLAAVARPCSSHALMRAQSRQTQKPMA